MKCPICGRHCFKDPIFERMAWVCEVHGDIDFVEDERAA